MPDTYFIFSRFKLCLDVFNYTVFFNNAFATQWIQNAESFDFHYVVALESPHNVIHLAVGEFYAKGKNGYDADIILEANGDMGDNEIAGFDFIFFFHHCFIDYVFWKWQIKNELIKVDDLQIISGYTETINTKRLSEISSNIHLNMNISFYSFQKPDDNWYIGADVTDIDHQLNYQYGLDSLDFFIHRGSFLGQDSQAPIINYVKSDKIDRAQYVSSFVIKIYVKGSEHLEEVEIGRDVILSRWNVQGCANCQNSLSVRTYVLLNSYLVDVLKGAGHKEEIKYRTAIHTHDNVIHQESSAGVEDSRTELV